MRCNDCSERVLDLDVVSLPDLVVTDLKIGDDANGVFEEVATVENGQFLKARICWK